MGDEFSGYLHQIQNNYEKIDIIQSGSLYPSVVKAVSQISQELNFNIAYFGRATLGMVSIIKEDGTVNEIVKEGYSIEMVDVDEQPLSLIHI